MLLACSTSFLFFLSHSPARLENLGSRTYVCHAHSVQFSGCRIDLADKFPLRWDGGSESRAIRRDPIVSDLSSPESFFLPSVRFKVSG